MARLPAGKAMNPDDLWAITCYFNPARYTNRYSNYKVFQERLGVPLLSTELVYGGVPQLGERDADRLIQLTGKDVLWQKERLLNVALDALPPSCRFVVWIDCDVVFENPDWALETREVLKRTRLVQPHGRVFDLRPGTALDDIGRGAVLWERESMARKYGRGAIDFGATSASMLREYSPGHAWAARRDLLDRVGFYDPMILGSGDFKPRVAKSKFGNMSLFAKSDIGYIALEGDHGQVSFRNIKIRPIQAKK